MRKFSNPPPSATSGCIVLAGVIGAVGAVMCIAFAQTAPLIGAVLLLLGCGTPMWLMEMRRILVPTGAPKSATRRRKKLRLSGVCVVLSLFGAVTTLVTQALAALAQPDILGDMLLVLLAAGIPWFFWILWRKPFCRGCDSVELLGHGAMSLMRRGGKLQTRHFQALLGWGVKAYFLPLMMGSCYVFVSAASAQLTTDQTTWVAMIASVVYLLFSIDTAFATIGYCSTSRRIDGHIRSTDSTVFGWAVTLVCYPPFNLIVLHQWLAYRDGYEWHAWLAGHPFLLAVWGVLVLLLTVGYVWSTACFGLRFSNLSYRGLVSSGPYRYFKHPSYLFKNISWWLIFVPFVSQVDGRTAAANCLGLLGVNCIYALRAWTEERHLAGDPDYRAYSSWMTENGVFGRLCRVVRFRRFAAP